MTIGGQTFTVTQKGDQKLGLHWLLLLGELDKVRGRRNSISPLQYRYWCLIRRRSFTGIRTAAICIADLLLGECRLQTVIVTSIPY